VSHSLQQCIDDCDAVLFDFAGTLFDERSLRQPMLENLQWLAERLGLSADDQTLRATYKRGLREAYIEYIGKTSYRHDAFFAACYRHGFFDAGANVNEGLIAEAVVRQNHNTATKLQLRHDCIETLRGLRDRGKHVQVVSNFDEKPLVSALKNSGLLTEIDSWTSSESAGSCKPDTGIFHIALNKAECDAADAIYVGDAPMHDVAGAKASGMTAVLIDPLKRHTEIKQPSWRPDFRIESLAALSCPKMQGAG
jgi:HAD superfamily hydrolase (TIGR01509 family)